MKLKTITYLCLYVSNFRESIEFYKDILGLVPLNPDEDINTSNFYVFKTGETKLAIERKGVRKKELKTKAENPFLLQFQVDSKKELEAMSSQLEKKGVVLIDRSKQEHYGLFTNFCDPDGNKLEIICAI